MRSLGLTGLFVASVAALVGAWERPVFAQAKSICDCPDVYDLINRLNMDEAAIAALQGELPQIEAADRRNGKPSSMLDMNAAGKTYQNVIRDVINGAMANVQMLGGQTSRGDTGGLCGSSVVQSSTKCMDEIVLFHEDNVHVPACDRDRAAGKTTAIGFRAPQATVDYVREEMAGYQAEINRIRQVLKALPASCRPNGWAGMIYFFEEKELTSSTSVSTGGINASSNTTTTLNVLKREVRILYQETGTPRGNGRVEEKTTRQDSGTMKIACTEDHRLTPDRTKSYTTEEVIEVNGVSEADVAASFTLDSDTGRVDLTFELPETVANGTLTKSDTVRGECSESANGTTSGSASFSTTYEKNPVVVEGVGARGLDVVRGSKTLDLAPAVPVPDLSLSDKARVTWAFYKVD